MNEDKLVNIGKMLMEEIYGSDFHTIVSDKKDLLRTPKRFAGAIREWFGREDFNFTVFPAESFGKVEVGDIDFFSYCEHHLAAIIGKVYITYTPDKVVAGLSKFPRAVKYFSSKPMIQEEFNKELFDFLWDKLKPKKLKVRVEALHTCMTTRGARSVNATTSTELKRIKL